MENILIVDDEKHYPMIIGEVLSEEGLYPVHRIKRDGGTGYS